MAIIGRIRKHSGLAVIIIGVAIAAFVIGDFGKKSAKGTNDISTIDGEAIPYNEFSNKVEETINAQKENSGNAKMTDDETYNIRTSTWSTLVKDLIMDKEYSELGLTVSSDELFDQVQGKNPHRYILQYFSDPKTGMYDQSMVMNYLKNLDQMEPKARDQWINFEKAIKTDRLETKFNNLITKAYYIPKAFLKKFYTDQTQMLKVRSISPPLTAISDSAVKLTDADYQAFYDKNKEFFYQEDETRDADYVVFEVQASPSDRNKIAADVKGLYQDMLTSTDLPNFINANSDVKYDSTFKKKGDLKNLLDSLAFKNAPGTFIPPFESGNSWIMAKVMAIQERPDTMKGVQLLVSFAGSPLQNPNIKRTKDQAKNLADSLLVVIKKSPLQLKELALKYSDFPTVKDDGGTIKEIVDGNANYAIFYNKGLTMKTDEVTLMETGLGYAIFKLTYKSKPVQKVRVALLHRAIEPSNQTYQDTYLKASAFAGQNRTAAAFEKAAAAQGIEKRAAQSIRQMDNFIMGMASAREVVRWSYNKETKIGDVSPVFDLNGKYLVAVLKSITEKGITPLDKVKDRIEQGVRNDKKIGMMAEKITTAMKTTKDIYALGAQFGAKVDTLSLTFSGFTQAQLGRENEIMGKLFTKKANGLEGPLKGRYGVYVVIIDEVIAAPAKDAYPGENSQMMTTFTSRVQGSLYEAIKKSAKIKDSRALFY